MQDTKLYIVVPCYNEAELIEESAGKLLAQLDELIKDGIIGSGSAILFVNDGSTDATEERLVPICRQNEQCYLINFVKNFGHQSAILAGIHEASEYADAVITIDADLQQDVCAIRDFVKAYDAGSDVVYGVRRDRASDGLLKKTSASIFYWLMHALGVSLIADSADYRLLSKKAAKALSEYRESNLFLRGLIPHMGFPSDIVYFDVRPREKGESKYTFSKMLALAVNGITSFSERPIRVISCLGILMSLFAVLMIAYSIYVYIGGGNISGYTTIIVSIWLVGGAVMLSVGVVGEYISKIYIETKRRPRYVIESAILPEDNKKQKGAGQKDIQRK